MKRAIVIASAALLLAAHAATAQSDRSLLREGNRFYDKERYPDAEVSYRKALESAKDPLTAKFNLGDALYKQGRYDEAAGHYESAAGTAAERDVRAQAYHNLGNARLKGKKLEESIEAYKEALKLNPKDEDTRYNLEYAKRLLQQQQQQHQQDKKDDKEQKDKKDQQDQKDQQQQDDQNKQDQSQKNEQQKDGKEQPRQPKDQISKADAERILEALRQQEQDVKKKLQKKVPVRVKVEKDW
ncbi:MAG TPA: tetratricopeptide repeat protein [Bacteroidota bacterium]|nr:tetratricopeptide repeat protein [Bacteroidota bacterium]